MHFSNLTCKTLKLNIIETTASIPTKFCTVIKTATYLAQTNNKYDINAIWQMAAIFETLNCHISLSVRLITTKFELLMHMDLLNLIGR